MERIRPEEFLRAFEQTWNEVVTEIPDEITKIYSDSKKWTKFMLSKEGFLSNAMKRINEKELEYKREYYTLDALYVGGEDLYKSDKTYPSGLHALIEHENGDNVEEEMWKLIFWRSPLKVIIFYDWNEYNKNKRGRDKWLGNKINSLVGMLNKSNTFYSENEDAKYLFIVGNRLQKNQLPRWRWTSNKQIQPTSLTGG